MQSRFLFPLLALTTVTPTGWAIEPSDLKPGLIATYSDSEKRTVTRLEPTVAITLRTGETPHPALEQGRLMTWKGYLNITRAGKYRFTATTSGGNLTVKVNGKDALADPLQLDGGVVTFEASFTRAGDGLVQIEVLWEGPGFIREPLAHQFLGHLPQQRSAAFDKDATLELGRFKFEEMSCLRCHRAAANDKMARGLADHAGPNLADVAKRVYPGWIYTWLANPAKLRKHTTMPALFADDAMGAAERYAVTQYLISLAGQPLPVYRFPVLWPNDLKQSVDRGRTLYYVTGCATCHNDPIAKKRNDEDDREPLAPGDYLYGLNTKEGPTAKYNLGALGSKMRPETLAAFLQNPLKTHPSGRMPDMKLNPQEALDIARYLCRIIDEGLTPETVPAPKLQPADLRARLSMIQGNKPDNRFDGLPVVQQWIEVGKIVFTARGCVNCHSVDPKGRLGQPTEFPSLDKVKEAGAKGCLDDKPNPARVAAYAFDTKEREAIAAFVRDGLKGAGSPAPVYQARVLLKRFNCLNCHQRDGEGGIPVELAEQMRALEKAENADDVRPPVLTGIGHKSRLSWLIAVLMQGGRARPWMQLRMPQYGESNVGLLPEALAALEGTVADDKIDVVEHTAAKLAAGRSMIGKAGLGCISCHDIGGIPNTGTRGPDLATINQRVRYEWYQRWLSQPLRMAPGTRMPQAFVDGKSTLKTVLDGDPHQQAEAMWAYLALGPGLPLPDGLEPPKGLIVRVTDRPEIVRTFMPDAGSKAIAVGYPGAISIAFSADQCRLAYAWSGNFLDTKPVWDGRGGAPAKLLGQKLWTAPPGHPWGLTANPKLPPDFLERANNPAFGRPLPLEPARIYDGPMVVQFDGYKLDKSGNPTFRYRLNELGKGAVLHVEESPLPLRNLLVTGFGRKFEITIPGGYQAWFLAGSTAKEPRVYDATGKRVALDLKAEEPASPAAGGRVWLPDGDRAVLLELIGSPAGTVWRFVPARGGGWLAVVQLPHAKDEQRVMFTLNLWALPKDDTSLLQDLFTK